MNGRDMKSQMSAKDTNTRTQRTRTNSLSKIPTEALRPNSKREFKQKHEGLRRLKKTNVCSTHDSCKNLRLFSLSLIGGWGGSSM